MAAETVSSALAQEAVSHVLSRIKESYAEKSDAKEHIERMEMAHIKLEAALETSNKWNITSVPLLRWQSKLKRATQECDLTLRWCRQRLLEDEEVKQGLRSSSIPKRVAHTAMSFVLSMFSGGNDDMLSGSTAVRRFERFADGATEFLRYVELGGTPCRYMFSMPLIRHLLAGKGTKYCCVHGGQHLSLILQPFSPPNHGMVGSPSYLKMVMHQRIISFLLSENTDIVGVVVRCLQCFIPYLSSTTEIVKIKLTQVPMQDLCWVFDGHSVYGWDKQKNNIHTICSKWFRPNLFCCQQHHHHHAHSSSSESLLYDVYMEPVIQVYLLGHVTLSIENNRQGPVVIDGESQTVPTRDFSYLKLGAHFWPHASSEDLSPAVGGSASVMINGEAKERGIYGNVSFEELGKNIIPKAVDCLRRNVAATSYQTMWKSKHGSAYLRVEKTSCTASTRKDRVGKRRKQRRDKKVLDQGWASASSEFISSWVLHAPAQLQDLVLDYWIQKGKQLILPLLLKNNDCVHDCPIRFLSLQDPRSLAIKFKLSNGFNP